jgi:hypothetical protein
MVGIVGDAVPFFFGAEQRVFRLAEADLGFAHSAPGSPVRNDAVAFAWFSVAAAHEPRAEPHSFLEKQISDLRLRMSAAEIEKAEQLRARSIAEMDTVPRFSDDP